MKEDKKEAASTSEAAPSVEQKKPTATLLGSISYESKSDYENFLNNLTLEHAVIVLISAANYSQSKGTFNLSEAELIAKAIKRLGPNAPPKADVAPEETGPQTTEPPLSQ
jgi:hypothetical protein